MLEYTIALDVGTSSMRAILFRSDGSIIHTAASEYHTIFPEPSYVEQEPDTWTSTASDVLRQTAIFLSEAGIAVNAITVTSQRASMIPMGADDKPLRNAIMWQDKRTIDICDRLIEMYGLQRFYRKTGLRVNPFFVLNKIIWLREEQPEIFKKTKKFIGVQDLVLRHLTGEYVTDWTQASRTMLMDLETLTWDNYLLELGGITEEQLCRLVPPGTVGGRLTKTIALETGLPADLPVIVSGGDQQNAAIALGVVHAGIAEANTGTGSFVLSFSEKPVFNKDAKVLCQASAVAGKYMAETAIFNTGAIFRWFKEQFYPELKDHKSPYTVMTSEAEQIPLGSNGVILLPHFEGSAAPYWNPMAKGIFFNLGLGTKRAAMTIAIMEGIALEISQNLALMRNMIGDINELSVAGGMVRSDLFCTLQADTTNATVVRYSTAEATALGAAINAWVTLGVYKTHEDALKVVGGDPEYFYPDRNNAKILDAVRTRKEALYDALDKEGVYEKFMFKG